MAESTPVISAIVEKRKTLSPERALLVGVSGIDGSGKGFTTAQIKRKLRALALNVALISADDWLNLPNLCSNYEKRTEHFCEHAVRLDEMFDRLRNRSMF